MSDDAHGPSAPAASGLAPSGVLALLDAFESDRALEPHSLIVRQHGSPVLEAWWAPYRRGDAPLLYSLSKSVTSTAVGFAVAEGLLDLDRPAAEYVVGAREVLAEPRSGEVTVRQLLRMASGHREDPLGRLWTVARERGIDRAAAYFAIPLDADPGTVFCYDNSASYVVATIVQSLVGEPLSSYLTPRLFRPLGLPTPYWEDDGLGREQGFSGIHLPTDAIAALGQLYLDGGRELLPEGWAGLATSPHTANPDEPNVDWRQGYGYQFWMARHGYRGDGAYGQFCIVLPAQDAVIAMTSETVDMQSVLDHIWEHLLPALDGRTDSVDPSSASTLEERLAALGLPPSPGAPAVVGQAPVRGLRATVRDADATTGTLVIAHDDGRRLDVPYASGEWRRSDVPVDDRVLHLAASGGDASGRFSASVVLLDTPHRLVVDGDSVAWRLPPLAGQLPWDHAVPRG